MSYSNIGIIKKTEGQRKKHFSDFTDEENLFLRGLLRNQKVMVSNHSRIKANELNVKNKHIKNTLNSFNIIEFNYIEEKKSYRVLLRGKNSFLLDDGKKYQLCCVISLSNNKIITFYWNEKNDSHITANRGRYEDFNIFDLVF